MPLSAGTRLGPYEILSALGAGGMGEVYRARDTKLDRAVAIKILPEAFAADTERIARFQREAKTLASLNHPNIAHIHGLEESDGVRALVMELVEGEDLAQRIERGAIPPDEALPIAKQVTDALEAAHEQGIIHRDLKPANIKVRPDGTVKVLDFGLAKAMEPTGVASPSVSQSPTITTPAMTQAGMILGTAAYMSPEQARGKPVDKRADIWAFGCVLYEMLTGKRAFGGEDVSLTLADVMKGEADWQALPATLPPGIRTVLTRCLQKDPKQRLRDIGDVRLALDGAFERAPSQTSATVILASSTWSRGLPWATAAVAVAAAVAGWSVRQPPPTPVTRFEIELRRTITSGAGNNRRELALSPDGRSLVYVEGERSTSRLMRRDIDQLAPTAIAGSEQQEPTMPFFSPDGGTVGFLSQRTGALMKIPIAGGTPVTLSERLENRAPPSGATWLPDGTIVHNAAGGLWRVPATGGAPILLLETGVFAAGPMALPGGRAVLFHVGGAGGGEASLEALVLSSGERRKIVSGRDPFYVPTGHLVFARANGSLWAAPFDVDRLTITREPTPLSLTAFRLSSVASAQFSVAANGSLAYVPGESQAGTGSGGILAWVGRNGAATPVIDEPGVYDYPRLSPDESRIAFSQNDIWVWDLRRGSRTRLTFDGRTMPGRGCACAGSGLGVRLSAGHLQPSWGRSGQTREHPHRLDESGRERYAGARSIGRAGLSELLVERWQSARLSEPQPDGEPGPVDLRARRQPSRAALRRNPGRRASARFLAG